MLVEKFCDYLEMANETHIKALTGTVHALGMLEITNRNVSILFHELQENAIFGVTFSLNHHQFLLSHVNFHDFTTG